MNHIAWVVVENGNLDSWMWFLGLLKTDHEITSSMSWTFIMINKRYGYHFNSISKESVQFQKCYKWELHQHKQNYYKYKKTPNLNKIAALCVHDVFSVYVF